MTAVVPSAAKDLAVRRSSATAWIGHRRKNHHRDTEGTEGHRVKGLHAYGALGFISVFLCALCASVVNASYAYPAPRQERA